MLPKQHRLPGNTRFTQAKVYKTPLFLIRCQKNNLETSRFGFVVSKRIDKRATQRNRLKRVFRSLLEVQLATISSGNDILFILSPTSLVSNRNILQEELQKALQTLHLQ